MFFWSQARKISMRNAWMHHSPWPAGSIVFSPRLKFGRGRLYRQRVKRSELNHVCSPRSQPALPVRHVSLNYMTLNPRPCPFNLPFKNRWGWAETAGEKRFLAVPPEIIRVLMLRWSRNPGSAIQKGEVRKATAPGGRSGGRNHGLEGGIPWGFKRQEGRGKGAGLAIHRQFTGPSDGKFTTSGFYSWRNASMGFNRAARRAGV